MTIAKSIEVLPYDLNWPKTFEAESSAIKQALGDNCLDVHHIGSTAVPGLIAKPIIDIIAVVREPKNSITHLESLGYAYRGEMSIPFRFYFSRKIGTTIHLHVYEADSPEIELNLLFRDYLRHNPNACTEYAKCKKRLLNEESHNQKVQGVFTNYTLGKNALIQKTLQVAGFNKLRLMHCTHHAEWEATKEFRQKYFFDSVPIADPYTWTFDHKDHIHFVLYKGVEIVGYAHLQLWPETRAAIRIIVIEEHLRNQGLGSKFLDLCEKWLKQQGYTSLHVESSPKALAFYQKHDYVEMPFNDPDGYESDPQDIDVGKIL